MDRVRKVNDFDTYLGKASLECVPLWRSFPIIAFEEDVESQFSPRIHFVGKHLSNGPIDAPEISNDLESLRQRNYRTLVFGEFTHLIRDHTGYQIIAAESGLLKDVQVAYVEQVESSSCVTDSRAQCELL